MIKSQIPTGIKTFKKYMDNGTLILDCPIQRKSGLWSNLNKSLLIHSILSDYIIPNIYLSKKVVDGKSTLSIIDGLQRISVCLSFIEDEWSTHAKTPPVVIDGVTYDIALKKYSELDEEVKSALLAFRFSSYQLESCSDEEIEEIFSRLNNGVPLSKIQSARPKLGMKNSMFFNELKEHPFYQNSLNMTVAMLRREDDFLMLLTTAMLLDALYYNDYEIGSSASATECVKFTETIRESYADEKRTDLTNLVEYLDEAFGDESYKFLRKNNIPIVSFVGWYAYKNNIEPLAFSKSVVKFFEEDITEEYKWASGSGNVKMVNVRVRIKELYKYIQSVFPNNLGGTDILQNSEVISDSSSSNQVSEDNPENKEEYSDNEAQAG